MAYSKQDFYKGQTLTHTHLNNIEDDKQYIEEDFPTDDDLEVI